jgi:hypothetical protein
MRGQVIHSAVVQRVIVTFPTNKNVKPDEILRKLRAQFGDKTLSKTWVFDWKVI